MFTLAQWIARLTKGYIRYTGKKPDGLAHLKIKLEAAQKFKNQKPDPSKFQGWTPKVIKGGKKDLASGGIARVGFSKGKLVIDFIEKLFIKASNDIRLGRGKWKGLTQPQWIKQHDDLTKMLKKWEMGGKKRLPEGAEQYLGMNDLQISRAVKEAEKKVIKPKVKDEYYSKKDMEKEWAHENKLAKQEMKQEDQMIDKALSGMDERTLIKTKYPGISDDLLNKILIDDNPQRKADVMATMDEYLKLREIGKSEAEAYDIITRSFKKIPTKHASGGIAGQLHLNDGGRVSFTKGGKVSSGLAHVLGV